MHNYQRVRHKLHVHASTHDSVFAHPLLITLIPDAARPAALPSSTLWVGALQHARLDNASVTGLLSATSTQACLEWLDSEVSHGRRVLYVAFGSQLVPDARLLLLLEEAFARLASAHAVSVLWSLKTKNRQTDKAPRAASSPHVRVEPLVAQQAVLARTGVAAFMSHAGANSLAEALAHAVPLLLIPFCGDQPSNAAALEARGAALVLSKFADDPEEIVSAVLKLVDPASSFQTVAQRLSTAMHAAGGVQRAADVLELSAQRDLGLSSKILHRFRADASRGAASYGVVAMLASACVVGVCWAVCYACLRRCCCRRARTAQTAKKRKAE